MFELWGRKRLVNGVGSPYEFIFDFNDEGLAESIIDTVPTDMEETAKDAINQCPTEAIVEE